MSNNIKEIIKTVITYVGIVLIVIIIRIFFIDPVRVDGRSMNTTLKNGEVMLLNKIIYKRHDIKRFDIVVIKEQNKLIIKRVIGMPGETISYKDNVLYINGEKMEDPYPSSTTDDFSIEDIGHTKVPGDTYFVMGDNRSDSLDSRYPQVGVINKTQILGRARFVIWPINRFGIVK
ncbi:MAG: signal peptidase I [Bacilli bacterium]|nr:signal peptidase I [Bacilli bacterium]